MFIENVGQFADGARFQVLGWAGRYDVVGRGCDLAYGR